MTNDQESLGDSPDTDVHERLKHMFETMAQGVVFQNAAGEVIDANPAAERILGLSLDRMRGRPSTDPRWDTIREDGSSFPDEEHPAMVSLRTGDHVYNVRMGVYNPYEGRHRWLLASASPRFRPGEDQPCEVYTSFQDITAMVEIEEALRNSEERYRSIMESSPMGMHSYRLEPDGRLVFIGANPAADRIIGLDNAQFLGMTIEEAFPPLAETEIPDRYREVCRTGKPWSNDQVFYHDEKITGAYDVRAFSTGPDTLAVMFLDITDRKRADKERAALEEQLMQSQKMEAIGRLAGGVAHDFNNLLTGISGYASMVLEDLPHGSDPRADVLEIQRAAERATDLTRQLLAFSRKQIIVPKVLQLNEVIASSRKMLGRIIGEDIDLRFFPDSDLWPIRTDPSQVDQILINLATNSRDALPTGGRLTIETQNVEIDADYAQTRADVQTGQYVMLVVSDDGAGMDQETVQRIFEPFFSTKEQGQGTGLGLSTVYGIVRQNDGFINVYSEKGVGTSFKIYFPRVEGAPNKRERAAAPAPPPGGRETVLVVEDEAMVRDLAQRILEGRGYRVLIAQDCEDALMRSEQEPGGIDLLLTDVVMPKMNGLELYESLRKHRPDLRVIYMSGYSDSVIAHHGVLEEGVWYVQKPFTSDRLLERVRQALDE